MKAEDTSQKEMIANVLSQMNRKIRLIEERIDNLKGHLELIENNMLEMNKSISAELDAFNKTARELRREMQENIERFDQITESINQLASKDSVKVIEKYIDLLNPLTLVTRDEVDEIIDEKLKLKDG